MSISVVAAYVRQDCKQFQVQPQDREVFVLLLGLWSLFSVSPFVFGLAFFDC